MFNSKEKLWESKLPQQIKTSFLPGGWTCKIEEYDNVFPERETFVLEDVYEEKDFKTHNGKSQIFELQCSGEWIPGRPQPALEEEGP